MLPFNLKNSEKHSRFGIRENMGWTHTLIWWKAISTTVATRQKMGFHLSMTSSFMPFLIKKILIKVFFFIWRLDIVNYVACVFAIYIHFFHLGTSFAKNVPIQVNLYQKLFFLQNMGRTCCVQNLFWMSETISVHNMFSPRFELGISMFWTCNSMNTLSSYCEQRFVSSIGNMKTLLSHIQSIVCANTYF